MRSLNVAREDNVLEEAEEQAVGLVNGQHHGADNSSNTKKFLIRGFLLLMILGCFLLFANGDEASDTMDSSEEGKMHLKVPKGQCKAFCQARFDQRTSHHGGDYRKTDDMLRLVQEKQDELKTDLKEKYGEDYFDQLFYPDGQFRGGITSPKQLSKKRFQRKLQIKILQVQNTIQSELENLEGCDCVGNAASQRRLDKVITLPELPDHYTNFIWTTAGHSAAAGKYCRKGPSFLLASH